MSQTPTQTQSQTQTQLDFFESLPTYTRYELELRLLWLNDKLRELREKCMELERKFIDVNDILLKLRAEKAFMKLANALIEVMKVCSDETSVIVESVGGDRVLVEDGEAVKTAVITVNDREVWYRCEGESK